MTSENERRFREKLSILNENFLRFLQKAYSKTPDADFSPPMKDYTKHLRALDKMYYVDESAGDEAQTVITSSASTTTASAADMTIISTGAPSLFISSTVTNSTTATSISAGAGTGANFLFGIGASKMTAPMTATTTALTTSAGSSFAFGSSPSTTASPSATTTTASATFPLLFGTQPKTTAPAAVPSSVPTFSFGTAKFPSFGSSAGTLFGSTTANTLTTISQPQVNGGSRKRSAAQSVDDISPYGKRTASSSSTETSSIANAPLFGGAPTVTTKPSAAIGAPFLANSTDLSSTTITAAATPADAGTGANFLFGIGASKTTTPMTATTTALTTSAGSPFAFGSSPLTTASPSATTTTATATFPLLFGTQPKTTAPAAVPSSVPTFSFGTAKFPSFGSAAGTLFGSTTANTLTTTATGANFLFGIGASKMTAPMTATTTALTTSAGSSFAFGSSPSTTASPSATTTTASATFPLLFGTQPKTTAPAAVPSSVPTFSFGTAKFPSFGSAAGTLFGSTTADTFTTTSSADVSKAGKVTDKGGDSDDEAAEEFVPTDTFKPIVPLPPKVDVKSGEENEEVLFSARCKLFRYDPMDKKNKERGIGELKLLHNRETGRSRCVIRSDDQLFKLFANFPVLATMISHITGQKPNVRTLQCRDFSESSEGIDEVFLLKFRDQTTAEEFANKLEETGKKLGETPNEKEPAEKEPRQ
ncbi:hypothetical protein niasHT_007002 [Heterodera trifolii]|uniref:RanBD1 domain-containing protein n=1 Tax=Heterodera trifolii TaxID=157864 RepID=A0ABD2M042_9BILA